MKEENQTSKREHFFHNLRDLSLIIVITVIFALFLKTFVIDVVVIQSSSMEPTLIPGDIVLVDKLGITLNFNQTFNSAFSLKKIFHKRYIKSGDVVIFKPPGFENYLVKRVIGYIGDNNKIHKGNTENTGRNFYFTLGDNLSNSFDSRYFGAIQEQQILGNAVLIILSWNYDKQNSTFVNPIKNIRWDRIGKFVK